MWCIHACVRVYALVCAHVHGHVEAEVNVNCLHLLCATLLCEMKYLYEPRVSNLGLPENHKDLHVSAS